MLLLWSSPLESDCFEAVDDAWWVPELYAAAVRRGEGEAPAAEDDGSV